MNIQKVTKADAETRLEDHMVGMRSLMARHAELVKQEKACRFGGDFGNDFVDGKGGEGTKLILAQDQVQTSMDLHAVWITIYKRLLRGFANDDYQEAQAVVGGLCEGCKQPHRELTERDGEYYCEGCYAQR